MPTAEVPSVFLIGASVPNRNGMLRALIAMGLDPEKAGNWIASKGREGVSLNQAVISEFCGRMCYRSFDVEMNKNLTRVRNDTDEYMRNIIKSKHGSILEHCTATLVFVNVSRVFTHEIVRHRAGTAFSQESLRFITFDDLKYVATALTNKVADVFDDIMYDCEKVYQGFRKHLFFNQGYEGSQIDDAPFNLKKQVTSAARRVAPIGLATSIAITANHRAWRHMIQLRTSEHAEEELRYAMSLAAEILSKNFPEFYSDMEVSDEHYHFTEFEEGNKILITVNNEVTLNGSVILVEESYERAQVFAGKIADSLGIKVTVEGSTTP